MIQGLNHITLAVSDLKVSFEFYKEILGLKPQMKWGSGAYFDVGGFWFCLSQDPAAQERPHPDYTHLAFSLEAEDFESTRAMLISYGVDRWKVNRSEGNSFYFLDPDGHKLELHTGSLETRLNHYRKNPPEGAQFF